MTSVGACSADDTLVYGGAWFAFSVLTFALSRTLSPKYFPATYSRVASEPGGRGYWDSSVASLINGVLLGTAGLGAIAVARQIFDENDDAATLDILS